MKEEIRQFGEVLLWAEGDGSTNIPLIFSNMSGRNFSGKEYRDYIKTWILHRGFEVGQVELWRDGALVDCGNITLRRHE